jgi:sulfopyruvate decarboxylase subunit alpha
VVAKGQEITYPFIIRLKNFAATKAIPTTWWCWFPSRPLCRRWKCRGFSSTPVFRRQLCCLRQILVSYFILRMPVSQPNSLVVYQALKKCGIRLLSALPETWLVHLIRMAEDDPEMILVRLAKEEEGVGISAGAHFAGVKSAMLMQNHGFLASVNGIVSFAQLYRIPLLMLISYRGHFGERDPWQTQGGGATEPVLRALGIPYAFLDEPAKVEKRIAEAHTWAYASLHPAALLLTRELMWEEA